MILLALPPITALIELLEGHALDLEFGAEVLFYGVAPASAIWLLLTVLARNIDRRIQGELGFEQHQRFTEQLAQRRDWSELTKFVAQFPGNFLPVTRSALYLYNHRNVRPEFVVDWNSDALLAVGHAFSFKPCELCPLRDPPPHWRVRRCLFALDSTEETEPDEYCLPLAHKAVLVGILRLRVRPGQNLPPDQLDFLNTISPDMALALTLAIAHPRQIAQARLQAQIEERRHIAYELHDSLAQELGFLQLSLDRLAISSASIEPQELEQMRQVASAAYERIRRNLYILRSWEQSDFAQILSDHALAVGYNANLEISFTTDGEPSLLSAKASQQIFGLLQEGLNNVIKHAHAKSVAVTLNWSPTHLTLTIRDDGAGFEAQAAPPEGHYGLAMMQERTNELKGELEIESSSNRGACLTFKIPLNRL